MKIEIKSWITGSILFECEADSIKIAFELAVKQGAYLRGADLQWAYLQGADLRRSDLRGADLRWADLRRSDLRGADLQGAELQGADLRRSDLRGADLRGTDLRGVDLQWAELQGTDLRGEKIDKSPLMFQGLKWDILITKQQIKIGCQWHKAEEWFKFKDKDISDMHSEALVWWKSHKKFIKSAWEIHCKEVE